MGFPVAERPKTGDAYLANINRKHNYATAALVIGVLVVAAGVLLVSASLSKRLGDVMHIPNVSKNNFPLLMGAIGIGGGLTSTAVGGCLSLYYKDKKVQHKLDQIEVDI